MTKSFLKRCEFALFLFCTFSCTFYCAGQVLPSYNCTGVCAGLENSSEVLNDAEDLSSSEFLHDVDVFNSTVLDSSLYLRFATPCETPNGEVIYCLEISKCPVLAAVKGKRKYADFIEASKCGPVNEDRGDFKVCCGKYNGFRNVSKTIDVSYASVTPDDLTVLPKQCGTHRLIMRGRIVGGIEAALGEYPWMARIIHKNKYGQKSYGCAGFLIHSKYVVTAAHCMHSEFTALRGDPYSVLLGEHNVTTKIDCSPGGTFCADPLQVSRISQIVVHENYSSTSKNHYNDIALIYLNKAVRTTDFVRPLCMLTAENVDIRKYYISGWGKTETYESSPVKLKVDLAPFDKELCKEKFRMIGLQIESSQICAGGEKMKDSCNGDSGGPLMMMNGSQYFAAGLVSYGIGCGMQGWPGVYTSVPSYVDWIKSQISQMSLRSPKIKKRKKMNKNKD